MFNTFAKSKTILNQGEKIIELSEEMSKLKQANHVYSTKNSNLARENLNLTGIIDDIQEEILFILDNIENYLTINSYSNNEVKIRKTLEYVRTQKDILEKDLEKNNKLVYDNQSEN